VFVHDVGLYGPFKGKFKEMIPHIPDERISQDKTYTFLGHDIKIRQTILFFIGIKSVKTRKYCRAVKCYSVPLYNINKSDLMS